MSDLHAPTQLRCEYLCNPLGLDEPCLRLSWQLQDHRRGARQSAYQIVVASSPAALDAAPIWDTARLSSAQSTHVVYQGPPLKSRQRYDWKVRTWDAAGQPSPWSQPASWEMGLAPSDWHAAWIGSDILGGPRVSAPCPYLRKSFTIPQPILSARLYITALGLYECHLSGHRVSDDVFTPGWTDYTKRVQYQSYDVTAFIRQGDNVLGAILGDGWCCGHVCWVGRQSYYDRPRLLAQLHITCADGAEHVITTDETWKTSPGPLLASDLLMGEHYDARLELTGWSEPRFDDRHWRPVQRFEHPDIAISASASPPVRRTIELQPISHTNPGKTWPGKHFIYDLGQNMVGRVRLKIRGPRGLTVRLRYAEMLNPDGTLYTVNLRSALSTDYYTLKGDAEELYEPRFTFHGFRYVEVEAVGLPDLGPDAITGIVLHSDLPTTGDFACSDPLITRLQQNIQWGQRGNFIDVPTDCPQRDERLGWTGDAQVFAPTACFNMDVAGFFTKWTQDLRDAQNSAGAYPMVAPNHGFTGEDGGPAWADAGIICPWTIYQCYGDTRILERHYPSMVRFVDYLCARHRNWVRVYDGYPGFDGFGDWLATDTPPDGVAPTPKSLIGTAYFARSVQLLSRIAAILGKTADAQRYQDLWQTIRQAFCNEFVTSSGAVGACTQTGYLLALSFDLVDESKRPLLLDRLIAAIRDRKWHLSTGFVGTPLLAPTLSRFGRTDVAYRILLQQTYPGWLYSVLQGATTIWERWNGWTQEHGFGDKRLDFPMNSFNHYAYGSIGQWLYATVAGISLCDTEPAYRHIIIHPQPGGDLTWAKASLNSLYGPISTHWQLHDGRFSLDVSIPPNTRATVYLPTSDPAAVLEAGRPLTTIPDITLVPSEGAPVICQIPAGRYSFQTPAPHPLGLR